jgi:murein tripeptide amidase MpaA
MSEMSELEKQLYSWTPRRPSATLERRLFAVRTVPADALAPFRFNWLAPATAALALACVLFNQRYGPAFSGSAGARPMVAMILSNQSAAAYLPGSVQAEQNNLPADAFRWANNRAAAPGNAPLPHFISSKRP